jgi:CBS domain-containing protein
MRREIRALTTQNKSTIHTNQKVEKMVTIGQVMTRPVKSLKPETTVEEAIAFLTQQHIGGAPVINDDGELVGMISELVLIDVVFSPAVKHEPVSNYMTTEVHSVDPTDPLSRAAQLFTLYKFRRLPVVENGKLVGIFSRRDLMNYALRSSNLLTDPLVDLFPSLAPVS